MAVFATTACHDRASFEAAIAKHRHTLVDQVNPAGTGLPFFTVKTLNPVWEESAAAPIVVVPRIKLVDQDGKERDESMFAANPTVLGFMFASCEGFCPLLVDGMKGIDRDLRSVDVQFVAITVDPERDTPQRLKTYATERGLDTTRRWTLLTGDKSAILALAKETFASQAFQRPGAGASFVHSEHLYVLDKQRRLRGILNGTRTDMMRDVRRLFDGAKLAASGVP